MSARVRSSADALAESVAQFVVGEQVERGFTTAYFQRAEDLPMSWEVPG